MDLEGILGVIGLVVAVAPYVGWLVRWAAARRPARHFLSLNKDHPIEVIVSTNATQRAAAGDARSYTTAIGELRAVAVGARTVLPLYKRKKVSVYMSEEYPGRLQGDILLLGGPLRNKYSESFLKLFNRRYPGAQLLLEADARRIGLGERDVVFDQRRQGGVPREDLALLVVATGIWSFGASQRVVVCAGLSTYGTEGAARFLFQEVLRPSVEGRRLRRLLSGSAAAAIVHVTVEKGRAVRTELLEDLHWAASTPAIRPAADAATVH